MEKNGSGQPVLHVGIMTGSTIDFEMLKESDRPSVEGFAPPSFILRGVTIGVDFHWQRKQDQVFAGDLRLVKGPQGITAVNDIGVEDYLLSVISSEMKATASLEFLKAHAIISRSWVMCRILHRTSGSQQGMCDTPDRYVHWFDNEDHEGFDVCADDHCQRYQGLSGAVGENVRLAIDSTRGEVLTYGGELCDARFSKCCGGVMETFDTCWEDRSYPYLQSLPDTPGHVADAEPFCHTSDREVLSQVLNDYDMETPDFYSWSERYSVPYLSELVARRSGIDFGTIRDLVPLERGGSGRIRSLKIVGDRREMTVGKELIIRRWLSESHLKSSAFDVVREADGFVFKGRGWGHGVGLCQIGAAMMASRGYTYKEILAHYYPGSELKKNYGEE